jgi:hypothetical protein
MANGDVVRKITISATGENIDSTTRSLNQLNDASAKASAANDNLKQRNDSTSSSLVNLAAGIYVAKTAYEALGNASEKASASMGGLVTSVMNGVQSDISSLAGKVASIWQEGIDKLNSYIDLNQKAGDYGVEFYQRITKAATDAKKPANEYLDIIKNINKALDRSLGTNGLQNGSTFNTLATELQNNGNLKGQAGGVSRLNNSVDPTEQFKAAKQLLDDVFNSGQKLVGFKLAEALGGDKLVQDLKDDNFALEQIQKNIDGVKDKDIIPQATIDHAEQLKQRLEDATKYIDSWFPKSKSDWSGLGIQLQEIWTNAIENTATVLHTIDDILARMKQLSSVKFPEIPTPWKAISDYFTQGMSPEKVQSEYGVTPLDDAGRAREVGLQKLRDQMTAANTRRAITGLQHTDDIGSPDQSKPSPAADKDTTDAVDRAINALNKHIEAQKADAAAIGLGDGALASFKATAAETAAVAANGGEETAAQAAQFAKLKVAASDAADALARAKVASEISRGAQTAFLSPGDVQIANQLKGIYGDDIPAALASSEAAALRMNKAMSDMNTLARDSAAKFANDFVSGIMSGKSAMDSLVASANSLGKSLTSAGINNIIKDPTSGVGYIEAGIGIITQLFTGNSEKKKQEEADRQAAAQKAAEAAQAGQDRADNFTLQGQLSTLDTNTIAGQIQAFDLQANKQRADEARAGGQAIVALENTLAIERKQIVDKANQQVIASYKAFLDSIKTGDLSTLSPEDQLKFAKAKFSGDITGANAGNQNSINAVTQDAQNLLNIAKSFFASTTGYSEVYQSVTDAVNALVNKGSVFSGAGYAAGGLVTNGQWGVDSVTARVAGGEFITRSSSVTPTTLGALQHINRTGSLPGGDNAKLSAC